jgi:hypothetical protein
VIPALPTRYPSYGSPWRRTLAARIAPLRKHPPFQRAAVRTASLGITSLIIGLLTGCTNTLQSVVPSSTYTQASGNWQFSSSDRTSALPALAGNLTVNSLFLQLFLPTPMNSLNASFNCHYIKNTSA